MLLNRARKLCIGVLTTLLLVSLPAFADRFSDAVCGENCPRSGNILDLIIFIFIIVFILFIGSPAAKLFILIWLGTPLSLIIASGEPLWILAYIPSFFLGLTYAHPIAKYFGWEKDSS